MADIEQILGKRINTVKELKAEISALQDSIVNATEGTDEWVSASQKLNAAQTQLAAVTSAGKQSVDAATDSIVGMEREYKNLYNTYKLLSEEQRNSDFGKNMAASLNTLSEKINSTKKDVGNFTNNIGHYAEGAMSAFSQLGISVGGLAGPMKIASAASKGLGASLKALIANPVGAVIMAIVVAFKALEAIVNRVKEAINSNEESQMRLKEAMSAFQPIIDGVKNAFDALAQVVVKFVGWIGEATTAVRKFFASAEGKKRIEEQAEAYKKLAKAENDLIKRKRDYQKLNADDEQRVATLREEASEMENGKEKAEKLSEAKRIQAELDARNIELAKQELELLKQKSQLTANSTEDNQRLADAEAKVSQAEAAAASNARKFNKELKNSSKATRELTEEEKKLKEILDRINKEELSPLASLDKQYKEEFELLKKYGKDTTKLTSKYQEERRKRLAQDEQEANDAIARALGKVAEAEMAFEKARIKFGFVNDLHKEGSLELVDTLENTGKAIKEFFADNYGEEVIVETQEQFNKLIATLLKGYDDAYAVLSDARIEKKMFERAAETAEGIKELLNGKYLGADNTWFNDMFDFDLDIDSVEWIEAYEKVYQQETKKIRLQAIQDELADWKGADDKKIELETEAAQLTVEIWKDAAMDRAIANDMVVEGNHKLEQSYYDIADSVNSITQGYTTLYKAQIESGKLDESEKKKKQKRLKNLAKLERAVGIASVVADTAGAIMGVWKGFAGETVANAQTATASGPAAAGVLAALNAKSLIAAIAKTAALGATAAGQIAAIQGNYISTTTSLNEASGSEAAASAVATPSTIDSTPYSYTRTLQTEEEEDALNRPVWVSVVDIIDAENKVAVTNQESSF